MTRLYRVEGTVQGVGFRYFVMRQARRIGVSGWVRNTVDHTVEAQASGSAAQLDEFARALRSGPATALVTNVHMTEIPDEEIPLGDFQIKG